MFLLKLTNFCGVFQAVQAREMVILNTTTPTNPDKLEANSMVQQSLIYIFYISLQHQ